MKREDRDLADALTAVWREIGGLQATVGRKFGLSTPQARLLCLMSRCRPSFGELAGLLGCDKTNVTGMVDRLERRMLLRREVDAQDRRISRVVLTDEGVTVVDQLRAEFAKAITEALRTVPATDRRQLTQCAQVAADTLARTRQ